MSKQPQLLLPPDTVYMMQEDIFIKNCIVDRWSKYSVLVHGLQTCPDPQRQAKLFFHTLRKESFFKKATHNSYAWRCERLDGYIAEWYTDDGEKWAGLCILRELRKAHVLNCMIVVTRYYGGIKLEGDRFRHVIDCAKVGIEHM